MNLRLITLAGDSEREASVAALLTSTQEIELVLRCVDRVEGLATIRGAEIAVVLAVGPVPWFDYQCIEEARERDVALVGIAADPIEAELLEVAGFTLIDEKDVVSGVALASTLDQSAEAPVSHTSGRVIAVWGAKGAPGRTTIAIELAHVLAESGSSTVLVDADLYGGDVAQMLGVVEELPGIVAWSRRASRGELRSADMESDLRNSCADGPAFLPGLTRAELWDQVSPFGCKGLITGLRASFATAVWDVGFSLQGEPVPDGAPGRNEVARMVVAEAEHLIAVVKADPIGLKSFLWAVTDRDDVLDRDKLLVVANRVRAGEEAEVKGLLRRYLGRPPIAMVPDRPDHLSQAVSAGCALASIKPDSQVCQEIREVAASIGGRPAPRGFLSRLAGRRSHV